MQLQFPEDAKAWRRWSINNLFCSCCASNYFSYSSNLCSSNSRHLASFLSFIKFTSFSLSDLFCKNFRVSTDLRLAVTLFTANTWKKHNICFVVTTDQKKWNVHWLQLVRKFMYLSIFWKCLPSLHQFQLQHWTLTHQQLPANLTRKTTMCWHQYRHSINNNIPTKTLFIGQHKCNNTEYQWNFFSELLQAWDQCHHHWECSFSFSLHPFDEPLPTLLVQHHDANHR